MRLLVHTMASSEDTEITLGVGKLLGLFFLLAAICGVFFAIGYSLGRSSGREQAANDQTPVTAAEPSSTTAGSDSRPSAAVAKSQDTASSLSETTQPKQQPLTFYKAVQQNGTEPEPASTSQSNRTTGPKVVVAESKPPAKASAAASTTGPDVISHTSPVTGPGTIVVQIAALSREDDAVALAGALRKKNYNVFVVNNPVTNDKFYHVQVGPFTNLADAQAMRVRLVGEGYNPIIKK
jgi:DedD protein